MNFNFELSAELALFVFSAFPAGFVSNVCSLTNENKLPHEYLMNVQWNKLFYDDCGWHSADTFQLFVKSLLISTREKLICSRSRFICVKGIFIYVCMYVCIYIYTNLCLDLSECISMYLSCTRASSPMLAPLPPARSAFASSLFPSLYLYCTRTKKQVGFAIYESSTCISCTTTCRRFMYHNMSMIQAYSYVILCV